MLKKSGLIGLVVLSLLMMGSSTEIAPTTRPNQNYQDNNIITFKTPEDAITFYVQGVAQGDFNKTLQACAIDEMSQNFKFDLLIDRLKAFVPYQALSPANAPLYVEINKAQLSAQIGNQVKYLVYGLLSSQPVGDGKIIPMDLNGANTFIKEVDVQKLTQLQVTKIGLPNKSQMATSRYTDLQAKIARVYGADEATERVALFSFGSDYYVVGFSLLRYGDNWKIYSQTSAMANFSSLGSPGKISPDDFDKLINGQ